MHLLYVIAYELFSRSGLLLEGTQQKDQHDASLKHTNNNNNRSSNRLSSGERSERSSGNSRRRTVPDQRQQHFREFTDSRASK